MASQIKTYFVVSSLPVVVEDGGVALSYPPGSVFSAKESNHSVVQLLEDQQIVETTEDPTGGTTVIQGQQGPDGATGATGTTGAQGAQGIQGIQGTQGDPGIGGENNTASSAGGDQGLVLAKSGDNLPFKGLTAGINITLTPGASDITIHAADGGEVNTASSAGGTEGLVLTKIGPDLPFKGLTAGTNITLIPGVNDITIDASGSGEVNTASSAGGTEGLVLTKSGSDLPFKGLTAGANITLTPGANDVTITAAGGGGGEVNTASSAGGTEGLVLTKIGPDLPFKGLTAGANITLTPGANDITITAAGGGGGEVNTASSSGGTEGLVLTKSGSDLPFKGLTAGTNITLTPGANDITITAAGGGGGGALTLIEKKEILAAVTTVTFSGLDGNTDGIYVLESHIFPNSAINTDYFLNPNGLTTNQAGIQMVFSVSYTRFNNTRMLIGTKVMTAGAGAAGAVFATAKLWARAAGPGAVGLQRRFLSVAQYLGVAKGEAVAVWTDTSTNITSLVVEASVASEIGIGSTLTLYKLDI